MRSVSRKTLMPLWNSPCPHPGIISGKFQFRLA
jgi:hypothetical protein